MAESGIRGRGRPRRCLLLLSLSPTLTLSLSLMKKGCIPPDLGAQCAPTSGL